MALIVWACYICTRSVPCLLTVSVETRHGPAQKPTACPYPAEDGSTFTPDWVEAV